ncbi:DUF2690 domain-containing protein [Nonomuraea sp. NPDC050786]|uniref:DUF2690 domain-containing protein n=1 Tax=Nonomuraea sp. NPDC050786 TaxID=3154840 RepID=UPI0033CC691B
MRRHRMPVVLAVLTLALAPWSGANAADPPDDASFGRTICFGTDCDGKDPVRTGCTANSSTVRAGGALVRAYAFGGYVELRYGPGRPVDDRRTCQVNWARFVKPGQNADYNVWVERERPERSTSDVSDKRLTQYSGGDEGTGVIYSDQVYAPTVKAMACVEPALGDSVARAGAADPAGKVCTNLV